jgi:SAM-dependent methyltransferase
LPDAVFATQRLAEIYDVVEGQRGDLDHYLAIADELGARSVLDVGCGTGTLACLLADRGIQVAGVDPVAASLASPAPSPAPTGSGGWKATPPRCPNCGSTSRR